MISRYGVLLAALLAGCAATAPSPTSAPPATAEPTPAAETAVNPTATTEGCFAWAFEPAPEPDACPNFSVELTGHLQQFEQGAAIAGLWPNAQVIVYVLLEGGEARILTSETGSGWPVDFYTETAAEINIEAPPAGFVETSPWLSPVWAGGLAPGDLSSDLGWALSDAVQYEATYQPVIAESDTLTIYLSGPDDALYRLTSSFGRTDWEQVR